MRISSKTVSKINEMNKLLEMSGKECVKYAKRNNIPSDAIVDNLIIKINEEYSLDLYVKSGDTISPAFWGEVFLKQNGKEIDFSEPLDNFNNFVLTNEEGEYIEFIINGGNIEYTIEAIA